MYKINNNMTYKTNTPDYKTDNKIFNYRDFKSSLASEKEELEDIKRGIEPNTSDTHKIPRNVKLRYDKTTRKMTSVSLPEVKDKIENIENLSDLKESRVETSTKVRIASMSRLIKDYELSHTPFEKRGFDEALDILKDNNDIQKSIRLIKDKIGNINAGEESLKMLDDSKKAEIVKGMSDFLKNLDNGIINESNIY
jgi:hypothetical protein